MHPHTLTHTHTYACMCFLQIEMCVCVCVAGEAVGTEEQTAVTITGVPQAAFADHNVQYQFRTENSGGQVSTEEEKNNLLYSGSQDLIHKIRQGRHGE